ncbi:MAG: radical SAM protein [Candidatus Omnitrophota bacterium]
MSKIDLVLIKPGNQKKLYGDLSRSLSGIEPPLWAALIGAFVRDNGHSVRVIDSEAENFTPDETAEAAVIDDPRLIAIVASGANPSASTPAMAGARSVLESLRKRGARAKTILTGLHPSALPERTMREEPVDFVCEGEGFYTISELLEAIIYNKGYSGIRGLWYRRGYAILSNPRAPLVKDLDILPVAAWDLLPMDKYRAHNWHCFGSLDRRQPYAVIYTSLGCPFQCSFCCIHALFGKRGIRYRSPEKVVEEIDLLVTKYGIRNLKILDECFVLDRKHVMAICDLLIERGHDLNIWAYARVDTIDSRMLKKMRLAGIRWLGFGIESANSRIRGEVTKGAFTRARIKRAVNMVRDAGIYAGANYIFGLPGDTLETMKETLDFAGELNTEYANFYVAMAYPGSVLYRESVRRGIKLPDNWLAYAQFGYETHPLSVRYLAPEEILRFRDRAFTDYFGNGRYQRMIRREFGEDTLKHIKREMLAHTLKRRLLGD